MPVPVRRSVWLSRHYIALCEEVPVECEHKGDMEEPWSRMALAKANRPSFEEAPLVKGGRIEGSQQCLLPQSSSQQTLKVGERQWISTHSLC
jgi:hypothetical protein